MGHPVTVDQVMAWTPCKNYPRERILQLFAGRERLGLLDILALDIPPADRLWAVLREDLIRPRRLRLFAVWCARQHLARVADSDPRSIAACDVAERYANGKATYSELASARHEAWASDRLSTWVAAWAAETAPDTAAICASVWAAAQGAAQDAARGAVVKVTFEGQVAHLSAVFGEDARRDSINLTFEDQIAHLRAMFAGEAKA